MKKIFLLSALFKRFFLGILACFILSSTFISNAEGFSKQEINSHTVVLMHFDNSTTYDSCGNTWTSHGKPVLSRGRFGNAIYLTGGQYIEMPGGIQMGNEDFTIDWWECRTGDSTPNNVIVLCGGLAISNGGSPNKYYLHAVDNGKILINGAQIADITKNQWTHYAIARYGNEIYGFKNGSHIYTGNLPKNAFIGKNNNDGVRIIVGRHEYIKPTEYYFTGYIDELRIVKGIAVWTSDFEPPQFPYNLNGINFRNYYR